MNSSLTFLFALGRRGLQEQSDSDFEVEELTSTTNTTHNNDNSMASENAEPSVNSGDAVVPDPHCETSSENFPTTDKDSYVNENNESEVDDDVDGCNKILEGVLKQTRYGRNPKKRSPFTIDVAEPKKRQRRESKKSSEDVDEVSSPPQSLSLPLNTNSSPGRIVNATINGSPGHLLVLSENQNNGCQIVQLYMVSPPPQTKPNTGFTTPVAEHDYVQPVEQTETVIATLPDDGTCIEITNATFESLDGVELLIPQEVVYEERLINTGESLQPYATQ